MTYPVAVPQISGDMDVLAVHASSLISIGSAFATTGAQVYTTWQGLAGAYDAPEIGELLEVMLPVREVSTRLGAKLETVGQALAEYASTVKPIKERLEALQVQSQAFASSVAGHDDWREDATRLGEHNQLLSQVSESVAEWMAAQRTCAEAISSTYSANESADTSGGGIFADVARFAEGAVGTVGDWFFDHSDDLASAAKHGAVTTLGAAGMLGGGAMIAGGVGGEVGGIALDATGIGAIGGVPINIGSAGLIASGAAVTASGVAAAADGVTGLAGDFSQMFSDSGRSSDHRYVPAPKSKNLPGFPGTARVKPKTPVQGGGGLRPRWKDGKGNIYEWDSQHGEIEKYNKRGKHSGSFDPETGEPIEGKGPDADKTVEP